MSQNPQFPPGGAMPPPPPPVQTVYVRQRRSPWAALAIGCAVIVLLGLAMMFILPIVAIFSGGRNLEFGAHGGNVAVIDVAGEIHTGGGGGGFFRESGASEDIMDQVREAAEDGSIKAVVLNVNSPGGTPAASQAIAEEVQHLAAKKPVVVSMGDLAASGAYYVASQATKIMANPSTLTGSIGVRMEVLHFYDLMKHYGVSAEDITSGAMKDMGSPFRPMRPDERALIESIIQDTYNQFVSDVAKGRKMDLAKVKALADGRVFTGSQALKVGLVDQLGNLHDAIALAGQLGGITGKPSVRHLGKTTGLEALFGAASRLVPSSRFPSPWAYPAAGISADQGSPPSPQMRWGDR